MLLTAKLVAALQLPPGKAEAIHFDAKLPGFGYRLRRSGGEIKRSWVVQYRRAGGTRRIKLGDAAVLSAEQARKHAMKVLGRVADGEDPQAERHDRRSKDKLTTRAVIEEYVAAKEPELRPRSFVEVKRYLLTGGYFRALHPLPIDTVTRRDIAARLVAITRESSSNTAAHARSVLNGFFVWAMRMGYLEANPVLGTLKPKESVGRSRVLSDAELAAVWRACGDDDHGCIVRLLILTACRRQEIGGLRWSELDEPRGIWTLPGTRSKNRRAHTLPLAATAWAVISTVPRMAHRDHLFGVRADSGFCDWHAAKRALDQKLGDTVAPFVLHDIRRTVATRLADLGVQPHVIEQILNHQSGHKAGIAGIYNRSSYEREVKAALAMWADHMRALAEGGERKVLGFPSGKTV
jgi:integrase